ncbi:hypothetical protein HYU23_02475 [Candidatus Woesearchaeota archaeon]|nr:hypothetical protein [Candidatus Woesearchaeota archaeon]
MTEKPLDQDPDFEEGDHEDDIYDEEGREELEESDEINELEEGFMEGYEEGEHQAKCAECGKVLIGENFLEEELDGKHYRFCSEECAAGFETHRKIKRGR